MGWSRPRSVATIVPRGAVSRLRHAGHAVAATGAGSRGGGEGGDGGKGGIEGGEGGEGGGGGERGICHDQCIRRRPCSSTSEAVFLMTGPVGVLATNNGTAPGELGVVGDWIWLSTGGGEGGLAEGLKDRCTERGGCGGDGT